MSACDDYIEKIEKLLPESCTVQDLVRVKIFNTPGMAYQARIHKDGPPYFQLGNRKKIIYPRDGIIQWLKERKHESGQKTDKSCSQVQGL